MVTSENHMIKEIFLVLVLPGSYCFGELFVMCTKVFSATAAQRGPSWYRPSLRKIMPCPSFRGICSSEVQLCFAFVLPAVCFLFIIATIQKSRGFFVQAISSPSSKKAVADLSLETTYKML